MNVTCCPDLYFLYKPNWAAVLQLQYMPFSILGEVQAMTGLYTWLPYCTTNLVLTSCVILKGWKGTHHEKIIPFIYE